MTYEEAFQNLLKSCLSCGRFLESFNAEKNGEATKRTGSIVKCGKILYGGLVKTLLDFSCDPHGHM